MIVVDKKLREQYRGAGPCDYCGQPCRNREAAHVLACGMGSGSRCDIPENLAALGGPWDCQCHVTNHAGHEPTQIDLEAKVAAREGLLQGDCRAIVEAIRRYDGKYLTPEEKAEVVERIRAERRSGVKHGQNRNQ
jgi:hypothetical protein